LLPLGQSSFILLFDEHGYDVPDIDWLCNGAHFHDRPSITMQSGTTAFYCRVQHDLLIGTVDTGSLDASDPLLIRVSEQMFLYSDDLFPSR